jgi:Tol biopolymer transport system component
MLLPFEGDAVRGWKPGQPTIFLATGRSEVTPAFSPDGRFIAYAEAVGLPNVFVRPFPVSEGAWRVSSDGGNWPSWTRTGELVFANAAQQRLFVASYELVGKSFQPGKVAPWAQTRYVPLGGAGVSSYALHPDGKRVALAAQQDSSTESQNVIVVFSHFDAYLRKLATRGR